MLGRPVTTGDSLSTLQRLDSAIITLTSWIVAYLTLQMTIVVLIGVFTRYVMNDALAWIEELARFSMIWLTWIGAGLALRRGAHLAVEFFVDRLSSTFRSIVILVGRLGILVFLFIVFWWGFQLTSSVSMQSTVALGVSMQVPYSAMPVGAVLLAYHLIAVMWFPWARVVRADTELQI